MTIYKQYFQKSGATSDGGTSFTLSDESVDRHGDVILASSWEGDGLKAFSKNAICLFNHNASFPLGTWRDVRVENRSLVGRLQFAPAGTSDRIDEVRRLVEARVLVGTSVGFRALASQPRKEGGIIFTRCQLIEASIVSIPSNENSLMLARSLGISSSTVDLVFAKAAPQPPKGPSKLVEQELRLAQRLSKLLDRRDEAIESFKMFREFDTKGALSQEIMDVVKTIMGLEKQIGCLELSLRINRENQDNDLSERAAKLRGVKK